MLYAFAKFRAVPCLAFVTQRQDHDLGRIYAIDNSIRLIQDFPIRRVANFSNHATAASKLIEFGNVLQQSLEPTFSRYRSVGGNILEGFKRS